MNAKSVCSIVGIITIIGLVNGYTLFSCNSNKGKQFVLYLFAFLALEKLFQNMVLHVLRRTLLLGEKNLSIKIQLLFIWEAKIKMTELLSLKLYQVA